MPKMCKLTLGDELFLLDSDEVPQAHALRALIQMGQREQAHKAWREWVAAAQRATTRNRRTAVGAALDLFDATTEAAHRAEEARRERLANCPMHVFNMTGIELAAGKIPPRLTCVMCTEWLTTLEAAAYARGFKAAGGDPNTVIEGFEA